MLLSIKVRLISEIYGEHNSLDCYRIWSILFKEAYFGHVVFWMPYIGPINPLRTGDAYMRQ